ncbi:MAG: hypothetical protein L0241_16400, partial [Planctomycetia bacterium]|nr:hypothetical protein [Planctomycetia bacterium]
MTSLSGCVRKSLRKVGKWLAKGQKHARKTAPALGRLEQLELRDVPATFYVATTGSDSALGGSTTPWRTLQHAADEVQAGDTVIVRAGTYTGFQITTDGTAANPIVFKADPNVLVNAKHSSVSAFSGAINL